jgi:NAD(P)-dependent dehydrogenase (short-subunit alcohol dehydrogenase family)
LTIDVTSDDSVKAAAETLKTQVEALDVLVNNAGISASGFKGPWEESLEDIKATYDVNIYGVIRTIRAFADLLKKSKAGRVVNVGSGLGSLKNQSDPTDPYYPLNSIAYLSSKTALNAVTVSFAKALAEWKIKVNTADPGYTATDLNHHSGPQSVDVGAQSTVFLATLPDDGPTGTYQDKDGVLPW